LTSHLARHNAQYIDEPAARYSAGDRTRRESIRLSACHAIRPSASARRLVLHSQNSLLICCVTLSLSRWGLSMSFRKFAFAFVVLLGACLPNLAQTKTVAERLGYPADAKLLIIHADDLAIAHSEDAASLEALDKGYVTSASIIVPGPWLTEVANYAKAHPDDDLG